MRLLSTFVILTLMSFYSPPAEAQRWSASEGEAWAAVSGGWDALRAEDVDGFMATFHPQFLGWNMSRPAPLDVTAERIGTEEFLRTHDWVSYEIHPVGIQVTDDVAVVHYRYREVVRSTKDGAVHEESGRALQVLKRHGGAWRTLSIMSGPAS